jgi:hypothetical protein
LLGWRGKLRSVLQRENQRVRYREATWSLQLLWLILAPINTKVNM